MRFLHPSGRPGRGYYAGRFASLVGAALLVLISGSGKASQAAERKGRPNIVLLFTDDQGYADVGCFGARGFQTPNLDRLAKEGRRFTDFYVAQAVCTASRAALMTGCYSTRVGLFGALNHISPIGIHNEEKLLPEICKEQGYATAIYGKWHLGHHPQFSPLRHGFDEFFGIPYSNDNGPLHPIVRTIPSLPLIENDKVVGKDPDQRQFTRWFTERAVRFIETNRDRPFFLYVPHVMPHVPLHASEKFQGRTERGLYGDVIEELDWGIGEVLKAIHDNGLDDNTLVIYFSDNGPFLSYGDHAGTATPLREGKLTTFEGGVRVPCIMRWTGKIPAGTVCNEVAASFDLLPTIARLIGAELPDKPIDGKDIWPLMCGKEGARSPHEFLFFYAGDELQAVRSGDWKLHFPHEYLTSASPPGKNGKPANFENLKPESMTLSGIRGIASRHGYLIKKTDLALYNLKDDIGETKNVAAEHPEVLRRLEIAAERMREELGDSLTGSKGKGARPAGRVADGNR